MRGIFLHKFSKWVVLADESSVSEGFVHSYVGARCALHRVGYQRNHPEKVHQRIYLCLLRLWLSERLRDTFGSSQCAARGGRQKGIGQFVFVFRLPFGNHFVAFLTFLFTFFAYPLLPPPCDRGTALDDFESELPGVAVQNGSWWENCTTGPDVRVLSEHFQCASCA